MKLAQSIFTGLGIVLALGLSPTAQAASDFTFISRNGVDTGTACDIINPCRSPFYAQNNTNAGGTITILDSGNYGAVNITKSLTIRAVGVAATITGVTAYPSTICITAGTTDTIVLEGLTLDGGANGIANSVYGVLQASGASVYLIDCTVKNYYVGVQNSSSTAAARTFIQRSNIQRNQFGLWAQGSGRVVSVLDSLIDGSVNIGVTAFNGGIVGMARSVINANPTAMNIIPGTSGGSQVISIGPSNIVSGAGAFSATVPFQ